jgi:hypothetical protein
MALVARSTAATLKDAYAGGYTGWTYRGDNHRDDCRIRDQGRMGPSPPDEIRPAHLVAPSIWLGSRMKV